VASVLGVVVGNECLRDVAVVDLVLIWVGQSRMHGANRIWVGVCVPVWVRVVRVVRVQGGTGLE